MMEASQHKDRVRAFAGTVIFHAFLLMAFLFFGLTPPSPMPHERGVLVLGSLDEGMGDRQPLTAPPPEEVPEPTAPEPVPEPEQVVTQDTEESIALPDEVEETHTDLEEVESEEPEISEPIDVAEEETIEEPEPEPDPRSLFPGQDRQTTNRQEHGDDEEEGDRGRPEGTVDADESDEEGVGDGVEYSLTGRDANLLPRPEYTTLAEGRVVVRIVVDREGNVIRASAGARGTNTTNATLHRLAEDAAKRARFNRSPSAPEEQIGTITYIFIRRN